MRWRGRKLLPPHLLNADESKIEKPKGSLLAFYVPLAMTPMLILALQPIAAAGITRMPMALEGLAVWGPLGGLVFLLRSAGIAFNEVVIARVRRTGRPEAPRPICVGLGARVFPASSPPWPLRRWPTLWFRDVIGLDKELVEIGTNALWLAAPLPLLTFLESYWQGMLVSKHRTRAVTGSVLAFLVVAVLIIIGGVFLGQWNGLLVTLAAFTAGNTTQTLWLRWKWNSEGPKRPEQPEQGLGAPEPLP